LKAREVDPKWVKSIYREGEAFFALENYPDAAASYWEAWHLEMSNLIFKNKFEESFRKAKEEFKNKSK